MIVLGARYIKKFKCINLERSYPIFIKHKLLSKERQNYSNAVLQHLNIKVVVHGEVPKQNRLIYAINHRSLLDIIVMEHIFSEHNKMGVWIAKQELFDAFYGEFFQNSGCVSVDLETKRGLVSFFKTIKYLLAKVRDLNIYIFPEGERNKTDKLLPFQGGAVKIAKANNLQIVPVFINERLEKVFRAAPYSAPKEVHVYFGELISKPETLEERYKAMVKEIQK